MEKTIRFFENFFKKSTIFKYGFYLSSSYRRSTGKVYHVSDDLLNVKVKIPLSYKNRNYHGSMFGGAMFSATDPFYMIQLITILGKDYVVWDKSGSIKFKRPGNKALYADFNLTEEFIEKIKGDIKEYNEAVYNLIVNITDKDNKVIYAEVGREVYIASKKYYKNKRKLKTKS